MLKTAQIYLLVGFFGSGKTTFIRKLLNQESQQKYAIIQNQFAEGEMGIEQPLIMDESGTPFSSFLQLPNGCICCSAKTDLIAAVQYIISNTSVRNIVVETNGLADPASSIKQFWFDEQMRINGQLHSVIAMISGRKWQQIVQNQILIKQVAFANKIIVSFIDLVGEEKYNIIQKQLKNMNQQACIFRSDTVNLSTILQQNTLFNKDILNKISSQSKQPHGKHHQIRSYFIKGICKLNSKLEIEQTIGQLLWESGLKILRIKGIISLFQHEFVYQLQGVQDLFQVKDTKTSKNIYQSETRILIVGQNLDINSIATLLKIQL